MNENMPSGSEAKDALDAVRNSQQSILVEYAPPIWLRFIMSVSYAAIFFGYGMTEHENNWALAIIVGTLLFALSCTLYFYLYRLQGIKIRLFPRSKTAEKINLYATFGFAGLGFCSRFLRTELGINWAPYFCALAACIAMFWLLVKLPTGEVMVEGK
ncbi:MULTISPECIES: hypothetical protein [Pseudoalteromonas]|uniref:Uncharacterized protein n=1 Tax=Pseudoalteromonas luteoviolacea (strain 2ta16) TaxID=1353533 RepID=V4H1W6_PSEL2|nr:MULTISPECIES: hypothetical protein [Pseudoalteromonas]ESP91421.1 hypothetical protein PL2TA16_00220 [Pseudoalteromonas luteoviolacea 2ta16]KZN40068.1 hypothetical protein N483_17935 [Pseudoalteromonas luteoviolacea NCIMB 1944]MCG7551543.1 hypothetical protein [Pseudoalteromonas sp. Of7M-16]